jgi:hypothetical protein
MMRLPSWALGQVLLFIAITPAAYSEIQAAPALADLPVDQIVDRMQLHDAAQSKQLDSYEAIRHYQVEYHGFMTTLTGRIDVQVTFDNASGKTFRVISQSGSKLLCEKVLMKAVMSEKEASLDKSSIAVTPANYSFQLVGTEVLDGRPSYVLHVDPLRPGKFLYRGRIWVDAADFAVARIEVEPARNPSFWISSTVIDSTNAKTDGVWLPQKNRSESRIRVGGTAVLTIDYGGYRVALASLEDQSPRAPALRKQLPDREHDGAAK